MAAAARSPLAAGAEPKNLDAEPAGPANQPNVQCVMNRMVAAALEAGYSLLTSDAPAMPPYRPPTEWRRCGCSRPGHFVTF